MKPPVVVLQDLSWKLRQWQHLHPLAVRRLMQATVLAVLLVALAATAAYYHRRQTIQEITSILTQARLHAVAALRNPAGFRGHTDEQLETLEKDAQALKHYSLALAGVSGFLAGDLRHIAGRYLEFLADVTRRLADAGTAQRNADLRTEQYLDALRALKKSDHQTRQDRLRALENATRELHRAREQAFQECRMLRAVLDDHALLQERVSAMISADVIVPREQLVPFEFDLKAALIARDQVRKSLPE